MTALSNVNNPSNVANTVSTPTQSPLNDAGQAKLKEAFTILHSLFGKAAQSPDLDMCGPKDIEVLLTLALKCNVLEHRVNQAAIAALYRGKVDAIVSAKVLDAVQAKEEYDALSPGLRAMMKAFPENVVIPFEAFREVFPNQTSQEVSAKLLSFNYKGNAPSKGYGANKHTAIVVPLTK